MSFPPATYELPLKFQHRYRTHIILFVLTFITTTLHDPIVFVLLLNPSVLWTVVTSGAIWNVITQGLWYSVPVLTILGAHEMGHYIACRRYNVDASLPYFLPAPPLILTGTFGAVIRIRERFPSRRALFDIAIAGPIAGFVALIPFLLVGMKWSYIGSTVGYEGFKFGDPLLSRAVAWVTLGVPGPDQDVFIHPMVLAAWVGQVVTALNLLPFGQLDGGHISYALFGSRARLVSIATLATTVALTFWSRSWIVTAIMMMVMAFFLGVRHPDVQSSDQPLGARRMALAVLALVIFVVSFTPVPIEQVFNSAPTG